MRLHDDTLRAKHAGLKEAIEKEDLDRALYLAAECGKCIHTMHGNYHERRLECLKQAILSVSTAGFLLGCLTKGVSSTKGQMNWLTPDPIGLRSLIRKLSTCDTLELKELVIDEGQCFDDVVGVTAY